MGNENVISGILECNVGGNNAYKEALPLFPLLQNLLSISRRRSFYIASDAWKNVSHSNFGDNEFQNNFLILTHV